MSEIDFFSKKPTSERVINTVAEYFLPATEDLILYKTYMQYLNFYLKNDNKSYDFKTNIQNIIFLNLTPEVFF